MTVRTRVVFLSGGKEHQNVSNELSSSQAAQIELGKYILNDTGMNRYKIDVNVGCFSFLKLGEIATAVYNDVVKYVGFIRSYSYSISVSESSTTITFTITLEGLPV